MQRKFRLTRSEDFKRVRRIGKSYAHPLVVLVAHASETSTHIRVGVIAGKTTGNAVYRNRAKRILREALRPYLKSFASGLDLILIARRPLVTATLEDTRAALDNLFRRAQILPADES
ncbi:MAG: ribonuclease P protein component [Anaerolineales bacterium]|uniref:ribonuclease P protein component n=1 Tax=Candidatus Villigracilis proximus TaxID=3140683 RepID=UPI0031363D3C|nr:ribonuclease P protein component [Anaerolineales bacterium]MBK9208741.1 ribonuclease P protein component [Anaerolineales bacterium]